MEGRFFARGAVIQLPSWELGDGTARRAAVSAADPAAPLHDPPLRPRDEAIFLLTAAAEIEHALMVQYLYAAYSVRMPAGDPDPIPVPPTTAQLRTVQDLLTQIAREEMGHLATVQNLLHLVGGPLNFNREHSPYASEIYPFRFRLEGLTLDSLAKYVIAESPTELPTVLTQDDVELLKQIQVDAARANDGQAVGHVGRIFARLAHLFEHDLADDEFRLDTFALQAKFRDWGYQPRIPEAGEELIIDSFPGADVKQVRAAAVEAVREIGEQGEGFDIGPGPTGSESHFERFFDIYKRVRELSTAGAVITWPVAENPNTTLEPDIPEKPDRTDLVATEQEEHASTGRINHPRTRAWAQLFNLRYRMLLGRLSHFLRLDDTLYTGTPGASLGDPTARGLLLIWTFDEMRRLKKIAGKLVQLPKDNPPSELNAGPPFELPYTLNLPEGEPQRWRTHLDTSRAAVELIRKLQPDDQMDNRDGFLDDLIRLDEQAQVVMQALAEGHDIPPESMPSDFQKVVRILEDAVRGFTILRPHGNFWAERTLPTREVIPVTRNLFLDGTAPFRQEPVVSRNPPPDGPLNTDPNESRLVQRLEGTVIPPDHQMPRFRPQVPDERMGFIRQWITEGCPDNDPPGQIGLVRERDPNPE